MNWLIRGAIIALILAGILALLFFPDATDNWFDDAETGMLAYKVEQSAAPELPRQIIRSEPDAGVPGSMPKSGSESREAETSQNLNRYASLQAPPESVNGSDDQVMSLMDELNPEFKQWLTPEEQIRKWVGFTDIIAKGKTSTKYRPLTYKPTPFKVITRDGRIYQHPDNYKRYDDLIKIITAVSPKVMADYYHYWQPVFQEAFDELGNKGEFNKQVKGAIDTLLEVEPLHVSAELKQPTSVIYKYADPEMERSSEVAKWVWRIGPDNAKKLQTYLRELRGYLGEK